MGLPKILLEGGLGIIKSAGRTAHEQEAAIRAAQNAKVAEQMANLPPRNKKANEALGLYHPVGGGIKLSKPVSGMHATTVPDPKFKPPKIGTVTPEQMVKEEAAIIPLVGDRAAAGRYLTHVGENELETPVRLTGGARYMDANYNPVSPDESAAWESGAGRISALAAQAGRAGEGGRPVYGMYVAGSGTNTDFNVMGANALIQQIPFSKITKKSEKAFDQAMREGSKAFPPIPEWPGIRSPLAQEMILDKSNGILRTKLFGTMGKEEFQSMGFPEVPGTRKAIIEPELLDVPTNQAGFRMARMDTSGRIIEDPIIPSDYPKAWAGQVAGKFDEPTDYKDIWQTHHEARRLMGDKAPASGDYYSFSRAHPIQYADQEWLDKLLQQRFANERKIKTGEYKEGGEVDMPNDDLTESDKKLHALIDGHKFKHAMKSGGKVESKIEGDDPDAKLHALIESRRKEMRMASGGEAFKAAMKASATEAKPIGFDKGGASFGFFPHLKAKRSKQDPEAAKNVPVDVARGVVSGVLGAPGDIESLLRIPYDYLRSPTMSELVTGEKKSKTFAPTSEDIEKKLPFKSDTPVSRAATGAGQLAGGFYYGPGSPLKVIANLPGAVKHGATEFAKASAAGAPHVMKPVGGNWIPGEVENAVKHLKRKTINGDDPALVLKEFNETYTPKALEGMYENSRREMLEYKDLLERDVALNQWVDNNLSNYLKKQMGTEKDPIRKLADEGITHYSGWGAMRNALDNSREQTIHNKKLRKILGMPEEPLAKTDLGRSWEEGIDNILDQGNMVEVKQLRGGHQWDQNPWLEKLPPDSTLYRLDRPSVDDMNLPHIMDVLREDLVAGRISPSDLKNISIDRAVRRTHEYNQEMAKKAEEATAKKLEGMTVYKEYPNGFKWVKLEKPGDFAAESDAMGHSVRGYEPPPRHPDWVEGSGDRGTPSYGLGGWEAIKSGKAQVYSLVDPKGNPHATIEAGEVRSPRYEEIRNHFDEAHKEVLADMNARGMDISDPTRANGLAWKRAEEIAREQGYQFVNQIKGKGNDRPINKYDPYTQDFVTSGDWTEVRDLQNTGLKLVGEAFPRRDDQLGFQKLFPEQRYVTPDEVNAYKTKADQDLIDQYKDWKSKVDFEDPQFKDYEGPEFISNEEYFKRYFPDDPAAQADFIRGGMDSPSMTPPESLGMKDWDTLMNEGVFSYDDVSFLNKVMPQRYLTAEDIAKAKARLEEPPLAEKSGGVIHMKKGGDDLEAEYKELSKPAFYPKVGNIKSKNYKSPQNKPFVDDPRAMEIPDVDVDVPTKENLEMSRRLAQRQGELEKQIQADRSPLDKLAGTIQGGRLLGSAMLQGINSMPTRLVHGDKAAEKFIQDRIYKPTNELGVEYAGDTAKFLEELETKYKLPPVAMGDVLGFAPLIQAGVGQAAKAAGSGTKNFAKALAETAGEKIAMGQPLVPGVPASITNPMVKHIIKPEGGNWQSGNRSVESRLKPYKQGAHDVDPRDAEELGIQLSPQDAALNKWIDSNLTNYMKKQLGTESDPIRKLADEGITHYADMNAMRNDLGSGYNQTADNKKLRQKFGMPPYSIAETPMGKSWEEGVDALIGNETQLLSKYGTQARLKKDPWMANLPKDTPFYGMPPRGFYSDLGMSHIIDVLREDLATGRIRPEQLNKVSMRQAVQRSHEYNQEMAKKAEAAQAKKLEDMTIYKEYPEGFRWVQLNKPGQFAAESDAMGHSVRGYEPPQGHPDYIPESGNAGSESYGLGGWEAIKSGDAKIYSLIDKDNKPHTTIEIGKGNDAQAFFDAHKNYLDNPVTNRDLSMMVDPDLDIPLDTQRVTAMKQLLDEMGVQYRDVPEAPPHINQIKGKGNRTPNEQYLPYVQDFVKSGKWSQVNDIDNSGLIEHSGRYFTEPELIEAAKKHGRMGVQDVPWEVARQRHMEAGISEDEALRNWIEAFKEGRGKLDIPPEGQKRGGLIHMAEGGSSYHPDVQDALKAGRITPNQAKWMSNYYKTPGNPEIGTAGIRDGISEKMMNYRNAVRAGEYTRPNWMESIPKEVKLPKWFDGKLDLDREGLRQLDKIPGMTKKAFNASEYSNTFPAGVNDANYYNELLKASKEAPDYQPYIDELNKLRERNQDIGKQDGGLIYMGPGGLIKNLLKMTAKEEALSKLPQMKAELAAKQALEAEYRKAMRDIPYDQQITLKEWESTRIPSASDAYEVTKPNIPKAKGGLTK